jgi:hypothetical protein
MGLDVQTQIRARHSFKTSGTDYPLMQLHIQKQKLVYKFVSNYKAIPCYADYDLGNIYLSYSRVNTANEFSNKTIWYPASFTLMFLVFVADC